MSIHESIMLLRAGQSGKCHEDGNAGRLAHASGDMAPAGQVLGKHDIAWAEDSLRAVADFNLALPPQSDDELPRGRVVKVVVKRALRLSEQNRACLDQVRPL